MFLVFLVCCCGRLLKDMVEVCVSVCEIVWKMNWCIVWLLWKCILILDGCMFIFISVGFSVSDSV